jgi:hypothetical protein
MIMELSITLKEDTTMRGQDGYKWTALDAHRGPKATVWDIISQECTSTAGFAEDSLFQKRFRVFSESSGPLSGTLSGRSNRTKGRRGVGQQASSFCLNSDPSFFPLIGITWKREDSTPITFKKLGISKESESLIN